MDTRSEVRDLSEYRQWEDPSIVKMFDERMVVMDAQGNPNQMSKEIFAIFADYHIEDRMPLNFTMPAMRVRWDSGFDSPTSNWVGSYAIPAPAGIDELPSGDGVEKYNPRFEDWGYGEVAQVLHVGPYEQEQESIDRLMQFISEQGYEVIGEREEEYLRGPAVWPPTRTNTRLFVIGFSKSPNNLLLARHLAADLSASVLRRVDVDV